VRTEKWADINRQEMELLADAMVSCRFEVLGKSTFKDEFVTAGGVDLKEINWKKMESKLHPNLFFAGEVLDIDAITGGFNFQAAWTTAWIASESISK
jgi:predicted flavoprotein YhiN